MKNSGPFPRTIYIPESRIERICVDALAACGLLPQQPEPIRIDRFVEKQFALSTNYENLQGRFGYGVMGACQFNRNGEVQQILVDVALGEDESKLGERRCRSTLAHESGHGLLHGEIFSEKLRADEEVASFGIVDGKVCGSVYAEGFACRAMDDPSPRKNDEWWEIQANKAMAALLLPKSLVTAQLRQVCANPKTDLQTACSSISEVFNVSLTMARLRIATDFECMRTQLELF